MICEKCGTPDSYDGTFCVNCGATLSGQHSQISSGVRQVFESPSPESLSGQTLDGKYRLDSKIAAGGMGIIYLATRLHIGDRVAIKVLLNDKSAPQQAAERFRREVQLAARLKHPNLVGIYDYGVTPGGLCYFVMEWVEGSNLRQIVKQRGALPINFAGEVIFQVCSALEEAHRQNIIHRDIKPDNIIVQEMSTGLRVKLLDLGVAKLREGPVSDLTQTGSVMGTPHYMSPEQCLGEEIDARADIYSLGIVLYEMLSGKVPFTATTSTAIALQHVTQPPPPFAKINNPVSPSVQSVVFHALEKKREARPLTALAFAQELNAAIYAGQSVPSISAVPSGGFSKTNQFDPNLTVAMNASVVTNPVSAGAYSVPTFQTGQQPAGGAAQSNKLLLTAAVIFGLLFLAGGGGAVAFWLTHSHEEEAQKTPGKSSDNNAERQVFNPSTPAPNAADEMLNRILAEKNSASAARREHLAEDMEEAGAKYPNDYRFPYQRAKILAVSPKHHTTLEVLIDAARIAIKNNQAAQILNDMTRDAAGDFRDAASHKEWRQIQNALQKQDLNALPEEQHHH